MSLNFDTQKVENMAPYLSKDGKEYSTLFHVFVMSLMTTGISVISEKDMSEILFRYRFLQHIGVSFAKVRNNDWYPDTNFILGLTGLRTNVSSKTRKQFIRDVCRGLEREVEARMRSEKETSNLKETECNY